MKRRKPYMAVCYIAALVVLTETRLDAQIPTWQKYWGGTSLEVGNAVAQTRDGGFIMAGGTMSFGAGEADMYLVKTDSLGETEWTRTYGGQGEEMATSVIQTADGGYALAGHTASFGAGGYDVYVVRTDSAGDTLWTRTYGTAGNERGVSMQITHDRGFIILSDNDRMFKTDSLGAVQWNKGFSFHYPGPLWNDLPARIEQTIDGGYIITGSTKLWSAFYYDAFLVKIKTDGDILWSRIYAAPLDDYAYAVTQTLDGHYLIAGTTESYGAGMRDAFVMKTNALGEQVWLQPYGGRYDDHGAFIRSTGDGGYLLGGTTDSYGLNRYDAWLVKLNTDGVILGWGSAGGASEEQGLAGGPTTDGGYVVAGTTESFGAGATDVFAAKLAIVEPHNALLSELNENFEFYDGPPPVPDVFAYPIRSQKPRSNDTSLLDQNDLWVLLSYPFKISLMEGGQINGEIDMNDWYAGSPGTDEYSFDLSALGGYLPSDIRDLIVNQYKMTYVEGPWSIPAEPIRQGLGPGDTITASYPISKEGHLIGAGSMTFWYDTLAQGLRGEVQDYLLDFSDSIALPLPIWTYDTVNVRIPLLPDSVQAIVAKHYTPHTLRSMIRMKAPESGHPLPTIEDVIPQSFLFSYDVQTRIDYEMALSAPFMDLDIVGEGEMDCLLEVVFSVYDFQPGELIASPRFPDELAYGDIERFPPFLNFRIDNDLKTPFVENKLHFEHDLGAGRIESTLPVNAASSDHLVVLGEGPIDLELTDPDGLTITQASNPVANSVYVENDVNGDLLEDDLILLAYGKPDSGYSVRVVADTGALPTDTYTLRVAYADTIVVLAQDVPISEIPSNPYAIGAIIITDLPDGRDDGLPESFVMYQNYPNPFNPATTIRYDLPSREHVRLSVYNTIGQEVATLVDGIQEAGSKTVVFNARNLPSGVYACRLSAGAFTRVKTMLLLR